MEVVRLGVALGPLLSLPEPDATRFVAELLLAAVFSGGERLDAVPAAVQVAIV